MLVYTVAKRVEGVRDWGDDINEMLELDSRFNDLALSKGPLYGVGWYADGGDVVLMTASFRDAGRAKVLHLEFPESCLTSEFVD
jgi:hypothetical protein